MPYFQIQDIRWSSFILFSVWVFPQNKRKSYRLYSPNSWINFSMTMVNGTFIIQIFIILYVVIKLIGRYCELTSSCYSYQPSPQWVFNQNGLHINSTNCRIRCPNIKASIKASKTLAGFIFLMWDSPFWHVTYHDWNRNCWSPFRWHRITSILARTSNHIPSSVGWNY